MRNPLTIAGMVLLAAWVAMALPAGASEREGASASQGQSVRSVAAEDCRRERRFDRREFRQDYRGTGAAAIRRCIREETREARWDCREERREDRGEYRAEYGTGSAAFKRCMVDELR